MNTSQTDDRSALDEGSTPSYSTHNINALMEYSVVRYGNLIGWVWRGAGGIKIVTPELIDMDPFEKVELLMSPLELAEEWIKGFIYMLTSEVPEYSVVKHNGSMGLIWHMGGHYVFIVPGETETVYFLSDDTDVELIIASPALATRWIEKCLSA